MTNEWPLSFFYIRENSKIYLEFIQIVDKVNKILKFIKIIQLVRRNPEKSFIEYKVKVFKNSRVLQSFRSFTRRDSRVSE